MKVYVFEFYWLAVPHLNHGLIHEIYIRALIPDVIPLLKLNGLDAAQEVDACVF